jgi:hypothetical protein
MKRTIEEWTVNKLFKSREAIRYLDYQREPTVWNDKKKGLLIDSILRGIDMPKLYLFKQNDSYDSVDGQQRIRSILEFLDGEIPTDDGRHWERLTPAEQDAIKTYTLSIAVIKDADDNDLRRLFLRLQLGATLNAGEKLHAMKGDMRDFVFRKEGPPIFQQDPYSGKKICEGDGTRSDMPEFVLS